MAPWPSPEASKRSEPATVESSSRPAAPTQASATAPAAENTATTAAAAPRRLDPEEVAMLRKMGDDYIAAGDFVGARAVLERAADAGEASAAFAIASTYDPVVLARFKVRGLAPDIVKAEFWYERARELGSSEAPRRLQAMLAARGN
jgi:TPR repeat protein